MRTDDRRKNVVPGLPRVRERGELRRLPGRVQATPEGGAVMTQKRNHPLYSIVLNPDAVEALEDIRKSNPDFNLSAACSDMVLRIRRGGQP